MIDRPTTKLARRDQATMGQTNKVNGTEEGREKREKNCSKIV